MTVARMPVALAVQMEGWIGVAVGHVQLDRQFPFMHADGAFASNAALKDIAKEALDPIQPPLAVGREVPNEAQVWRVPGHPWPSVSTIEAAQAEEGTCHQSVCHVMSCHVMSCRANHARRRNDRFHRRCDRWQCLWVR